MPQEPSQPRQEGVGPVVVGVDGSACSCEALRWGAAQATMTGRALRAVMTWDLPQTYGLPAVWPEDLSFEDDARRLLGQCVERTLGAPGSADVVQVVLQGHPALALVAESQVASLVVVGSRGHGEFAGMLLGSVSEYLTTHATCPVVVIRHGS